MYTVLIAEDELFVRLGIKNSIAWDQYDMQVVCDAEDGRTAWDNVQKYTPDIIITDILMPVMDGRQLIEKIQDLSYDPYVIVITCLQDFNLVRKLLSQGIRDYILKATMTEEEITKCLKKAQLFLKKTTEGRGAANGVRFISKSDQCNQAVEAYFQGLIPPEQAAGILDSNGIHFDTSPLFLALCPIEAVYDCEENSISVPSGNLYRNLFDLLQNRSYTGFTHYSFFLYEEHYIIVLHCNHDGSTEELESSALECFRAIHSDVQDLLHIQISFLICMVEKGVPGLKEGFQQSLTALESHYLDGMNSVVCSWDSGAAEKLDAAGRELESQRGWIGLRLGDAAAERYDGLVEEFLRNATKSKEDMVSSLMAISHYVCSFCKERLDDEKKQCDNLLMRYPYLTEGVSSLTGMLKSCEQYFAQCRISHHHKEMKKAIQIIGENLNQPDLSLRYISKQVGFSEAYFSSLFHQEMEMPFVKYIANARIERAKYLLEHTDSKLYDIAVQTGYKDDAYFSRVFKKATGISPSEWRSLWKL